MLERSADEVPPERGTEHLLSGRVGCKQWAAVTHGLLKHRRWGLRGQGFKFFYDAADLAYAAEGLAVGVYGAQPEDLSEVDHRRILRKSMCVGLYPRAAQYSR